MTHIRPGDRVAVSGVGLHRVPRIVEVGRVTKTQVVLRGHGDQRFHRKDGREVGSRTAWDRLRIEPLTRDIEQLVERDRMERVCSRFDPKAASDADLKRVVHAIELAATEEGGADHA